MKIKIAFVLTVLIGLYACQGSLSEEQRKKIKDEMESGKIQRVTEAELIEGGFNFGRTLTQAIEKTDRFYVNRITLDSLENQYAIRIFKMQENDSSLFEIERKILEAYLSGLTEVTLDDNIQIVKNDSILYTKPVLRSQPDGSLEFMYAIGIMAPKRTIVLSLETK